MKFVIKTKTPAGCCLVWLALFWLLDQILFRARSQSYPDRRPPRAIFRPLG